MTSRSNNNKEKDQNQHSVTWKDLPTSKSILNFLNKTSDLTEYTLFHRTPAKITFTEKPFVVTEELQQALTGWIQFKLIIICRHQYQKSMATGVYLYVEKCDM